MLSVEELEESPPGLGVVHIDGRIQTRADEEGEVGRVAEGKEKQGADEQAETASVLPVEVMEHPEADCRGHRVQRCEARASSESSQSVQSLDDNIFHAAEHNEGELEDLRRRRTARPNTGLR